MTALPRQDCFGYPVVALDEASQVRAIQAAMDGRQCLRAVQINVANLYAARKDAWLGEAYRRAELLAAEGRGIYFASFVVRPRLAGPCNGTMMMLALLRDATARGDRIYFLGAQEDVLRQAVANVQTRYGPVVAGSHHGYYQTDAEQQRIAADIRASGANLVLVGMSTPKKEAWIDRWAPDLSLPHLGVGGSFDVLAGEARLAPDWLRRAGLEWVFRLLQEPRRLWRRYLVSNSWFAALVVRSLVRSRLCGRGAPPAAGR